MSFRLVPKSVTLNDQGRRNGVILRYFSEFGYLSGVLRKSSRSLSHLLMSSCVLRAPVSAVFCWLCVLYLSQIFPTIHSLPVSGLTTQAFTYDWTVSSEHIGFFVFSVFITVFVWFRAAD